VVSPHFSARFLFCTLQVLGVLPLVRGRFPKLPLLKHKLLDFPRTTLLVAVVVLLDSYNGAGRSPSAVLNVYGTIPEPVVRPPLGAGFSF